MVFRFLGFLGCCGFTVLLNSCIQQPDLDCKAFHQGTFEFQTYLEGKIQTTTFTRTDTQQIEVFQQKKDTFNIRWINDCEYILEQLYPKNRKEKRAVHMRIIGTKQDTYTFEYSIVGDHRTKKGTATKLKS